MDIRPVLSLDERIERAKRFHHVEPFSLSRFLIYADGLDELAGKRVLEIGGTDRQNMAKYFLDMGAVYECVRLEENPLGHPWVRSERDFRSLSTNEPYDLIISCGVFEIAAIDKRTDGPNYGFGMGYGPGTSDLRQLFALTNTGGINLIGTISDQCLFRDEEIAAAGFHLQYRGGRFYVLYDEGYDEGELTDALDSTHKDSELVILGK